MKRTRTSTRFFPLHLGLISISFSLRIFPAKELKVCGSVRSGGEVCCSADMEVRLQARARDKHEKATKETLQRLHQVLSTRGTRFNSEYLRRQFCAFNHFTPFLRLRARVRENHSRTFAQAKQGERLPFEGSR